MKNIRNILINIERKTEINKIENVTGKINIKMYQKKK